MLGWFAERRRGWPVVWWRHVVPVVGAAIIIAVIVEVSGTARVVGAIWLVVGLVVLVAQRGRATSAA